MIGYAEREVFTSKEQALFRRATALVSVAAPYTFNDEPVRCHELARAVGRILDLEHEDGRFGFVEHTWLWIEPLSVHSHHPPWVLPRILDVYVPGAMPQVQLIDTASGLPPRYYLSNVFDVEINNYVVDRLTELFRLFESGQRL